VQQVIAMSALLSPHPTLLVEGRLSSPAALQDEREEGKAQGWLWESNTDIHFLVTGLVTPH
jgi:hypothetical protein